MKFLTHIGRLVIKAVFAVCYFTVADKLRNIKISLKDLDPMHHREFFEKGLKKNNRKTQWQKHLNGYLLIKKGMIKWF